MQQKKVLQGHTIIVINSEKAIITGDPKQILESYLERLRLGHIAQKGPNFPRRPEMILRRTIRGMLPWKRTTGRLAFKKVKCYTGIPEEYKNRESIKLEKKIKTKSISLQQLTKLILQR